MKTLQPTNQLIPNIATHPGLLISDELDARDDINQKDLAHLLDVKTSFLNEIIKGKRSITSDTAILLEKALGVPAELWMKLQSQYDLDVARIKEKNIAKVNNIEIWEVIKSYVPISSMKKMGYISDSIEDNIKKIYEIFNVKDVNDFINQFAIRKFSFYRKSQKLTVDEKNLFSWSAIAEYEAAKLKISEFKASDQSKLLSELKQVFSENQNVYNNIKMVLNKYGIKLVLLEKFNKTPVDGYSFMSNANPAIILSCRYKRLDYLAFTLFHELGHVYLHLINDENLKFLDIDEKEKTIYEDEADNFARTNLISTEVWKEFSKNRFPVKDQLILDFTKKYNIHPAILFGRMCYENDNFKIKSNIKREIN